MMLEITEFFSSIQGETSFIGLPCFFIRLTGCNLRCSYCDTRYAYEGGKKYSLEEVIARIERSRRKRVVITGGEPLLQNETIELLTLLVENDFQVLLETNGSLPIVLVPEGVITILDMKCPGSGMANRMNCNNLKYLKPQDQVKFVISDEKDFAWADQLIGKYSLEHSVEVLFSPNSETLPLEQLAQWILESELDVRLQPQLHKIIWGPNRQGV